jgi:hypothetical protein
LSHLDSIPPDGFGSYPEGRASLDDMLRPSLRHAFPLPAEGLATDDKFRQLLDALAQIKVGGQTS